MGMSTSSDDTVQPSSVAPSARDAPPEVWPAVGGFVTLYLAIGALSPYLPVYYDSLGLMLALCRRERLLALHRKELDALAQALVARETLNEQEILEATGLPPAPPLHTGMLPSGPSGSPEPEEIAAQQSTTSDSR